MKKRIYLLQTILGLLILVQGFSQSAKTITGTVNDNKGKGMVAVSVALLKAKDSSLVKAALTETDGSFEIVTNATGPFLLSYNGFGFERKFSKVFDLSTTDSYKAPIVSLVASSNKLEEVTVTSTKKPLIEMKAGKMVFNVESSINATGSDAMELLQKSPGVQVDNNDNITMKGKSGVKIYVDGKMLELDSKDLAAYLRSINSNDIEAIEMISNPSAKYDASGNAGIINIRLKKNKKFGTNGNANLGFKQGITPKGNGSVSLNYRDKKINIFSNIGGDIGRYDNTIDLYRVQNDTVYNQHGENWNYNKDVNAKVGADYFINSKSTFGAIARYSYENSLGWSNSNTYVSSQLNNPNDTVYTLNATNNTPHNRANFDGNLNYRFADTSGTEVNADLDYGGFRGRGTSYQPNFYSYFGNNIFNTLIYANNTPTNIDIYTGKIDAEMNKWKGKLGFGAKFSYVKTANTYDFYDVNAINPKIQNIDTTQSNSFTYKENINAGYVSYQRQLNSKWNLQAGLRVEQTNSEGDLTNVPGESTASDTVKPVKRSYIDPFPSGALTYTVNKNNTLTLTYSRRIDRPSYQDLNPFEYKLDVLTYQKGNPFLKPQYTNDIELTHTFYSLVNTTISYNHVKDYSTVVTDTIGSATYIQNQNVATQQILGFSIGSQLPIKKWWNGYANFWYSYQILDGQVNDQHLHEEIPMYGANLQNSYTLGHDYTAELSGWYSGPSIWGATFKTKPQGGIDLGVQKQFMQKKASIKLSATDIFHTEPWTATSNYDGLYIHGHGTWESRTFRVAFTYRFGNSQVKAARDRKTGLETEAGRIKGGG
jgi:outer membrane receptor protein involved in Fe transport